MPDWTKIAQTMAEGEFGDDWRKARAEEQAIKSEQLRNTLAQNADTRAAAGEARTQEGYEYGKTRRTAQEEMEAAQLKAAGLNNQQIEEALKTARDKRQVFELAGGAKGEADEVVAERGRRKNAETRADKALGLEGRRVGLAEEMGSIEAILREEQLKEAQRKNRFGAATYENAVETENYQNSQEGREAREMALLAGALRNMDADSPEYDEIAQQLIAMAARRNARNAPPAAPAKPPVQPYNMPVRPTQIPTLLQTGPRR